MYRRSAATESGAAESCYPNPMPNRRTLLKAAAGIAMMPRAVLAETFEPPTLPETALSVIPATGEKIPTVGMGSWLTFDVGGSAHERKVRVKVLHAFFELGGGLIDSSPMYGTSQEIIGHCLAELGETPTLFAATKVWIPGRWLGVKQMEHAQGLWGVPRFDLLQVHNLLDWDTHLATLKEWKAEGRVRYIGVTTSHGRRHDDLEKIMRTEPIDFVQLTYNIIDREAETRLLPLAQDRGIAVVANRPFQRSRLFDPVRGQALPSWARDIDCANWAQLFLKFIVSHPAVTCAIPATSKVEHMVENMGALAGRMPNPAQRLAMAVHYASL